MKRTLILSLFFLIIGGNILLAAEIPKKKLIDNYIAVFDLETQDVDNKISRPLTESIRRELVISGQYEVIDRGNMNKILGEQAFQMTGCVAEECVVEAGQLLGVGKIITGSVSIVGKTHYLSLSLINVQTGKIENISENTCKCEVDDLIDSSKTLVRNLLSGTISEPIINDRLSNGGNFNTTNPLLVLNLEVDGCWGCGSLESYTIKLDDKQYYAETAANKNLSSKIFEGNIQSGKHILDISVHYGGKCGGFSRTTSTYQKEFILNKDTVLTIKDNIHCSSTLGLGAPSHKFTLQGL